MIRILLSCNWVNKNYGHRIINGILATVFNVLTINYLNDWMMIKMSRQKKWNDVTHIFRQLQRILVDLQIKKNLYLNRSTLTQKMYYINCLIQFCWIKTSFSTYETHSYFGFNFIRFQKSIDISRLNIFCKEYI